ncbi:HNH endonuclease signature motif containing protein [Ruania alkalisoli]|nr:HNH endonuclease signature motif containing protein [Ruania alkalisoli]
MFDDARWVGRVNDAASDSALVAGCVQLLVEHQQLSLAEQLAVQLPGGALLDRLDLLDLEAVDEATLVEVVAAARRVEARVQEVALHAAAELAQRPAMNPEDLAGHTEGPSDVTGDELALRLCGTKREGRKLVQRGRSLLRTLERTGEALKFGWIDLPRAAVIADGLEGVSWQVAMAVEEAVIERAPRRTVAQLRSDVAKALIAVDPAEAEVRAQARRSDRHVSRPQALPDGVASLRVEGPAAEVLALDVALESTARSAKAQGDPRTLDQLRFDALTGLGSRALASGVFGVDGACDAVRVDGRTAAGGAPAGHADRSLAGTGVRDGGAALGVVGGRRPEIQVVVTLEHLQGGLACGGADADAAECLCAGAPCACGGDVNSIRLDDVPMLSGYGPITPTAARAIAAGGIWRRLVTDPVSRTVVDVGSARYRPPAGMAELVRARDGTCVRPGCGHQARFCQLDHTVPFDAGGPTSVANLGPLCVRDHLIKTHGDFTVTQPEPGLFEWVTPTGHRYRREREGTTIPVGIVKQSGDDPPF